MTRQCELSYFETVTLLVFEFFVSAVLAFGGLGWELSVVSARRLEVLLDRFFQNNLPVFHFFRFQSQKFFKLKMVMLF